MARPTRQYTICKLATVAGIDMNAVAETTLYTVPTNLPDGNALSACVITHVVFRNCDLAAALNTANFGFGFNATEDDVISAGVKGANVDTQLKYRVLVADDGAVIGVGGDLFKIGVDIAQGAACTMTVDVFGYLI